jgi:hypothetical protein
VFQDAMEANLVWVEEVGMGRLLEPATHEAVYDRAYFDRYAEMEGTLVGRKLTAARVGLVDRYLARDRAVVDVGVGSGAFVRGRVGMTYGYDVNPHAVEMLKESGAWLDPIGQHPRVALTLWDVLEHIPQPEFLLERASWVFTSLPLFTDAAHVLRSRHFRRDEHIWYWTRDGLVWWMEAQGFECVEHNWMESLLGREDIGTFVFRRSRGRHEHHRALRWVIRQGQHGGRRLERGDPRGPLAPGQPQRHHVRPGDGPVVGGREPHALGPVRCAYHG